MNLEDIATHVGLVNFSVSSILSLQAIREESKNQSAAAKIAFYLFILGAFSCGVALLMNILSGRQMLESYGLILAVLISTFAISAYYLLKFRSVASFVAPALSLIVFFQVVLSPSLLTNMSYELKPVLLSFHIAGALMGQILALAASLVSVLYLWQQRVLKRKLLNQLTSRVPALDILEKVLSASLWAGFLFLTAALISGASVLDFSNTIGQKISYFDKIIWAISVWLWYLAALLARHIWNIPAKRLAQMSLFGFMLLAMTFFGLAFFQSGGI